MKNAPASRQATRDHIGHPPKQLLGYRSLPPIPSSHSFARRASSPKPQAANVTECGLLPTSPAHSMHSQTGRTLTKGWGRPSRKHFTQGNEAAEETQVAVCRVASVWLTTPFESSLAKSADQMLVFVAQWVSLHDTTRGGECL